MRICIKYQSSEFENTLYLCKYCTIRKVNGAEMYQERIKIRHNCP